MLITHDNNVCISEVECATLEVLEDCTTGATVGTVTADDPDADGINNVCDLDDDNDGILDTNEGIRAINRCRVPSNTAMASQISTAGTSIASKGIDGSNNNNANMAQTAGGTTTDWWQVDLGASYNISTLRFYNRSEFWGESGKEQIARCYIFGKNTPFTDNSLVTAQAEAEFTYQFPGPSEIGGGSASWIWDVNLTNPAQPMRYFKIQKSGTNNGDSLYVMEFEAYTSRDTDEDGIPDIHDLDSDNDGCNDSLESGGTDTTPADGILDGTGFGTNGRVTGGSGGYNGANGTEIISDVISNIALTPNPAEVCEGTNITISATPTGLRVTNFGTTGSTTDDTTIAIPTADYNYSWFLGASTTPLTNTATYSGTGTSALTITNVPLGFDGNSYRVEVTTDNNGCLEEETIAISVTPAPVAGTTTDFSICAGDSVTPALLNASITGNDPGSWNATSGGAGMYTYTVPATAPCTIDATVTVSVTEDPLPTAATISSNTLVCAGDNAIFTITGTVGDVVTYSGASSGTATIGSGGTVDITISAVNADTTLNLTDVASAICNRTLTATTTVMVNGLPTSVTIDSNTPICSGDDAIFTITGIPGDVVTYGGVTSGSATIGSGGTVDVTLSAVSSNTTLNLINVVGTCNSVLTGTTTVTVNTLPVSATISSNTPVCSGEDAVFTITGTLGDFVTYTGAASGTATIVSGNTVDVV